MTEKEVVKLVLAKLEPHFIVLTEQYLFNKNVKKRFTIDAIIKPKDNSLWLNKDIKFGIEFKGFKDNEIDEKHFYKQIRQCADYRYCIFEGEAMPILLCPTIAKLKERYDIAQYNMFIKCLAAFNIGELKTTEEGLSIVFSDTHIIWSEKKGVKEGKNNKLKGKFGGEL